MTLKVPHRIVTVIISQYMSLSSNMMDFRLILVVILFATYCHQVTGEGLLDAIVAGRGNDLFYNTMNTANNYLTNCLIGKHGW